MTKTVVLAADHITDKRARQELAELFHQPFVKQAMVDPNTKERGKLSSSSWWEALFQSTPRAASVKSKSESAAGLTPLSKAVINARHAGTGASLAARKRAYGDPRTLYGKGGGVFGLARLSHTLMEAWMADSTLNANGLVATWHESGQKAGFKFLVTQIMGYQTGGPQRYTGRPIDDAHMHLAITPLEWDQFIQIAEQTLVAAKVPAGASRDLLDILRRCARRAPTEKHTASTRGRPACVPAAPPRLHVSHACAAFPKQLRGAVRTPAGHECPARSWAR